MIGRWWSAICFIRIKYIEIALVFNQRWKIHKKIHREKREKVYKANLYCSTKRNWTDIRVFLGAPIADDACVWRRRIIKISRSMWRWVSFFTTLRSRQKSIFVKFCFHIIMLVAIVTWYFVFLFANYCRVIKC